MEVALQHIYTGHSDAVYSLEKGLEEHIFYSGSADDFVGSWDIRTGTFNKPLIKASGSIYSLLVSPGNNMAYIGQRGGLLNQVDLTRSVAPRTLMAHQGDLFALAKDRIRHRLITAGGDGYMRFWDAETLKHIISFRLSKANVRCLAISPDQQLIAAGSSDHTIRIFDLDSLEQLFLLQGHQNSVFSILWLGNNRLISGGRDALIKAWDKTDEWQETQSINAHLYTVNHLERSPGGRYIASASRDKTVKIWDAATLTLQKVLDRLKFDAAHTHSVNRVLWIDDQTLLTAGDDKRILCWQIL